MNTILLQIQRFMDKWAKGEVQVPPELIQEYSNRCTELLQQSLNERKDKFTLRASNLGRPLCQLQLEKAETPREIQDNFFPMRMLWGHMTEALAVMIIKAAGIEVQSEQIRVIHDSGISGTYDLEIYDKLWDIKSASDWAFENKFKNLSIQQIYETDVFGYVTQGLLYADAVGKQFGGWIVINKSTGEFTVVEAEYDDAFKNKVLDNAQKTITALNNNEPFKKCFEEVSEKYYKVFTGNRVLDRVCSECSFKAHCWPNAQLLPQLPSKAKEKKLIYYTFIHPSFQSGYTAE